MQLESIISSGDEGVDIPPPSPSGHPLLFPFAGGGSLYILPQPPPPIPNTLTFASHFASPMPWPARGTVIGGGTAPRPPGGTAGPRVPNDTRSMDRGPRRRPRALITGPAGGIGKGRGGRWGVGGCPFLKLALSFFLCAVATPFSNVIEEIATPHGDRQARLHSLTQEQPPSLQTPDLVGCGWLQPLGCGHWVITWVITKTLLVQKAWKKVLRFVWARMRQPHRRGVAD